MDPESSNQMGGGWQAGAPAQLTQRRVRVPVLRQARVSTPLEMHIGFAISGGAEKTA
jgi:hypothetical protein